MQLANSAERYGAISRALHWLTALFVVVAWILGIMNDAFPKGESRTAVLFFHISVGLTIVDLVIMRMLWRYLDPPRPLDPTEFGSWLVAWTDPAGRIVHYCLYLLLFLVPASGVVLQFARGDALPIYGILEIPSFWSANRAFTHNIKEAHEILAHILMGLAILHSIAALIHHFVFGDRTLVRMLPPRLRS